MPELSTDASEISWRWGIGEQPAFSPRRASVPVLALERLKRAREHVVLGWFHRYPARFAADVVTGMLAQVVTESRRPVTSILDPFCGTAAVVAASRQLGLAAMGVELTTLGVTVGRLRLDPPVNPWEAAAFCERMARLEPAKNARVNDELARWLGDENARLLTAWRPVLETVDDRRLSRFVTVALSQSLRPSSQWLAGSVKVTADPLRTPIPLRHSLPRWARQLARDCSAEQDALADINDIFGQRRPPAAVTLGDARRLPLADAGADAIVTSPPYFVTYDYFDIQRLSYLAFGWPVQRRDQIGAKYGHDSFGGAVDLPAAFRTWYESDFGAERTTLGRALRTYVEDLRTHLKDAMRVVAPGGVVAYSVANSVRAGRVFDLAAGFEQLLLEAGFADVRSTAREQAGRRILPPGRDPASGRFSSDNHSAGIREYIVSGRRP
ncbi:hypothetical protein ACFWY5_15415 [Nonomuraea sp. NPDC059007]|uniref:hypothetical protein n=1 Tax=Nonomuraea sp. NPDC059007 TaxID=3346692 RepID=UPI0036A9FA07